MHLPSPLVRPSLTHICHLWHLGVLHLTPWLHGNHRRNAHSLIVQAPAIPGTTLHGMRLPSLAPLWHSCIPHSLHQASACRLWHPGIPYFTPPACPTSTGAPLAFHHPSLTCPVSGCHLWHPSIPSLPATLSGTSPVSPGYLLAYTASTVAHLSSPARWQPLLLTPLPAWQAPAPSRTSPAPQHPSPSHLHPSIPRLPSCLCGKHCASRIPRSPHWRTRIPGYFPACTASTVAPSSQVPTVSCTPASPALPLTCMARIPPSPAPLAHRSIRHPSCLHPSIPPLPSCLCGKHTSLGHPISAPTSPSYLLACMASTVAHSSQAPAISLCTAHSLQAPAVSRLPHPSRIPRSPRWHSRIPPVTSLPA